VLHTRADSFVSPVLSVDGLGARYGFGKSAIEWAGKCIVMDRVDDFFFYFIVSLVSKKVEVLLKPHRPMRVALISVSYSPQPDTSLCCEATDTRLVYRAACLFTPQLSPVPNDTAW